MTPIIQTYIDMGSSATKCLYWQGQPYLLHLDPQVARLNPARLDRLMLGGLTSQEPEDSAYVMVGNSAYAIGALAIAQKGDSGLALPKRDPRRLQNPGYPRRHCRENSGGSGFRQIRL